MILDGILILILLVACIVGYKCGLAATISRLGSWLAAAVLAFIFSGTLKKYLCDNTEIDENFFQKFVLKLSGKNEDMSSVPGIFQDQVADARNHFVNATAQNMTEVVMGVFAFLIILVGVKLISIAFTYIFSKKHSKGVIGFADGMLGMFMGLIIGIIIVISLMAFAVPFAMTSSDQFADLFAKASEGSMIAKYFYDYNLIIMFINDFVVK